MSAGHWAIVTGASGGIGAEFARQLAPTHDLLLVSRSIERLEAAKARLRSSRTVDVLAADLSTEDGVAQVVEHLDSLTDPIDLLINNAGSGVHGPFLETSSAEAVAQIALDVTAVVALTRAVLPEMVRAGRGGIINLGSSAGFQPTPHLATYGAAKAFVLSFTEAVAEELRGTGVVISVVAPGTVSTGFFAAAGARFEVGGMLTAEQVVTDALEGHRRRKTVIVPGLRNKLGTLGPRLLPRSLMTRAAGWAVRAR